MASTSGGSALRVGLLMSYALGWLRQAENQYLCCPPEIAREFDPELRRLLGYSMPAFATPSERAPARRIRLHLRGV